MKKFDLEASKTKFKDFTSTVGDKTKDFASVLSDKTKVAASSVADATKTAFTNVSESIKENNQQISEQIDKAIYEKDKKRLCPFFEEDLRNENFSMPAMIRIVDYDKRRDNKACQGAIGFETNTKDMKVLNIYSEFVPMLNLRFYPHVKESVYYIDPCYKNLYISLDDYFAYLKKVRVDELQTVAQDLGAKQVTITLKEQKKSLTSKNAKGSIGGRGISASANTTTRNNELLNLEVAAKVDFVGKDNPIEPNLVYFKNESDVNALIKMRLNPENRNNILSKTYSFLYSNTSGIKVNEAVKIDEALSHMNYNAGYSIVNEALSESRTILEYSIQF